MLNKDTIPQFIKLGCLILLLGGVLAWLDASIFEPQRTPPCQQENLPPKHICLDVLLKRYPDKIVWIDARSQSDFEINHLRLPDNRMFQIQAGPQIDKQIDAAVGRLFECEAKQECITVFCTQKCTLAQDVASALEKLQLQVPIYILEGGWDAIKKDGRLAR